MLERLGLNQAKCLEASGKQKIGEDGLKPVRWLGRKSLSFLGQYLLHSTPSYNVLIFYFCITKKKKSETVQSLKLNKNKYKFSSQIENN